MGTDGFARFRPAALRRCVGAVATPGAASLRLPISMRRRAPPGMRVSALGGMVLCIVGLIYVLSLTGGSNPPLRRMLGLSDALPHPLPSTLSVVVSAQTPLFRPRAAVARCGSSVTFANALGTSVLLRSAGLSPDRFSLPLAPHAHATIQLTRPGLYHYYDALAAHPRRVVSGNDVIVAHREAGPPREGWIAILCALPGLRQQLLVPRNHDLFAPKVLVATVGSTIVVSNRDVDAHNVVIDPHSPAGAAFVIQGTHDEPPHGWQRSLVVQRAGLYHVYCTFHARVIGVRDGWRILMPRHDPSVYETSSDFTDHNTMEAWIIVLPANATL